MKKPRPCPECPDYATCTELCETVEQWVSKDKKKPTSRIRNYRSMDIFDNSHRWPEGGDVTETTTTLLRARVLTSTREVIHAAAVLKGVPLGRIIDAMVDAYVTMQRVRK